MDDRLISPPLSQLEKLRQPLTAGERAVFQLFHRYLSKDWEIYLQPHLNGLRPDFVLLNPHGGIAVFEVKDWDLRAMRYFTKPGRYGPELWAERHGEEFSIQNQNPIPKVNLYKKEYSTFTAHVSKSEQDGPQSRLASSFLSLIPVMLSAFSLLSSRLKTATNSKNTNPLPEWTRYPQAI